jgi:hypothetical protein
MTIDAIDIFSTQGLRRRRATTKPAVRQDIISLPEQSEGRAREGGTWVK